MSRTLEQIEKELDAKIPRSAVSEREGSHGRTLSYLEGHYVIDRLNKIFGPLGWSKEIAEVKEVVNKTSKGEFPAYLVKVILTVRSSYYTTVTGSGEPLSPYYTTIVKEAYGYGCDKSTQNAHELAIKEAVTDALKVAAKDLGMSLGLALYDRTQENVDDGEQTPISRPEPVPATPVKPSQEPAKVEAASTETKAADTDKLRVVIRSHVKAAIKKGVLTMDEMKAHLTGNYAAETLDGVGSPEDLKVILAYVQEKTA